MNTLALLIISTTVLATTELARAADDTPQHAVIEKLRQNHPELFTAPELQPWPKGLPSARRTPHEVRCYDEKGDGLGFGVWMPQELGEATKERLLVLEQYPGRSQAVVDAIVPKVVDAVISSEAVKEGFGLQAVVMWGLVGIVVGAAATTAVVVAAQ
jgi:hypothetical protein